MNTKRISNNEGYEEEFKRYIAEIYERGDVTVRKIAEEYGISTTSVRIWAKQYGSKPKMTVIEPKNTEIKLSKEEKKQQKLLEMENDILKKALAIMLQNYQLV